MDPMSKQRSYERSSSNISQDELVSIMKSKITNLDSQMYKHSEDAVVASSYEDFFVACAQKTKRLNPAALAKAAKAVHQLNDADATILGTRFAATFSYAARAGGKNDNTKGQNLPRAVDRIREAAGEHRESPPPAESHREPAQQWSQQSSSSSGDASLDVERLYKLYYNKSPDRSMRQQWEAGAHTHFT